MLETILAYATMVLPWALLVTLCLGLLVLIARIVTKYGYARTA